MDVKLYKRFFSDVEYLDKRDELKPYTIMTVQGRQYPVDILYFFRYHFSQTAMPPRPFPTTWSPALL